MHQLSLAVVLVATLTLGPISLVNAQGAIVAHLNGDSQVPPLDSQAQGQFVGRTTATGFQYKLIVANISNVVAAHLHCAPAGQNGPVGVTLFSGAPVSRSGILAQGPILMPDSSNGCGWATIEDMVDATDAGEVYVNVHTLTHLPGEIRGQLR
jgi:hypothetical protein